MQIDDKENGGGAFPISQQNVRTLLSNICHIGQYEEALNGTNHPLHRKSHMVIK